MGEGERCTLYPLLNSSSSHGDLFRDVQRQWKEKKVMKKEREGLRTGLANFWIYVHCRRLKRLDVILHTLDDVCLNEYQAMELELLLLYMYCVRHI
jgi:hypothetical protein